MIPEVCHSLQRQFRWRRSCNNRSCYRRHRSRRESLSRGRGLRRVNVLDERDQILIRRERGIAVSEGVPTGEHIVLYSRDWDVMESRANEVVDIFLDIAGESVEAGPYAFERVDRDILISAGFIRRRVRYELASGVDGDVVRVGYRSIVDVAIARACQPSDIDIDDLVLCDDDLGADEINCHGVMVRDLEFSHIPVYTG